MSLVARGVACGYDHKQIVGGVDFSLEPCETLCVLGPNGVGKTTLFKSLLGFLPLLAGEVEVDGACLSALSRSEIARLVAYVPQKVSVPFSYTLEEFVLMGRAPHLRLLQQPGPEDRALVRGIIEELGIGHLEHKTCAEVSGGEMQMASIARALAQRPRYLVMDEPTASLDFGNQARVLDRVRRLACSGIGVIMTTHDPGQAFALDSRVVLLQRDGGARSGSCREVLTEQTLSATYGVEVWHERAVRAGRSADCCVVPLG